MCLRDTRGVYSILSLKSKLTITSLKMKSEAKEEYSIVNKVGSEKKKKNSGQILFREVSHVLVKASLEF